MNEEWCIKIIEHLGLDNCRSYEVFLQPAYPQHTEAKERASHESLFIDDHFILQRILGYSGKEIKILGVVDNSSDGSSNAEKRLYDSAKNYAECLQRQKSDPNLKIPIIDKTSRAKESQLAQKLV